MRDHPISTTTSLSPLGLALTALLAAASGAAQGGCEPSYIENPGGVLEPGTEASSTCVVDVDGQNGPDLVVTQPSASTVLILLNDGAGNFTASPHSLFGVTGDPWFVVAGDLDGQNGPDLVVARNQANLVTIYTNDGTGQFTFHSDHSTGTAPTALALGDANGTPGLDIAVAHRSSPPTVMLNDGSASFQTLPNQPGGGGRGVSFGQLDGQHGDELIVCEEFAGTVWVLQSLGGGSYTPWNGGPIGNFNRPYNAEVFDADGDGDNDVAVLDISANRVRILENDNSTQLLFGNPHSGTPVAHASAHLAIADLDGASGMDLIVGHRNGTGLSVFMNDGTGTYTEHGASPFTPGSGLTRHANAADLDGSGKPDLIAAMNDGVGAFYDAILSPGVEGENRYRILAAPSTPILPPGGCPRADVSAGGSFVLEVEVRRTGLPVAMVFGVGPCGTALGTAIPLPPIGVSPIYNLPTVCGTGTDQLLNVNLFVSSFSVSTTSAVSATSPYATAALNLTVQPGTGTNVLSTQAVILDFAAPSAFVVSDAFELLH